MKCDHVRVGVAIVLKKDDCVLFGKRKGSHGAGTWSLPDGHLEIGETVAGCASRELREETGIFLSVNRFAKLTFTNDFFQSEEKHYVTLYVGAELRAWTGGEESEDLEPQLLEPSKCEEWRWCRAMPQPLFLPIQNILAEGFRFW